MSAISDFFTTQSLWIAAPAGVVLSGLGGAFINSRTSKASDKRKAEQEDKSNQDKREFEDQQAQKKRDHEEKVEREKREFEAATELASVCNDIITTSLDVKNIFNMLRDMVNTASGQPDPKAFEKIAFAETQVEEFKRLTGPYQRLQMVGSPRLLSAGTRLVAAMTGIQRTITEPIARTVATKAAGEELNSFINTFREEAGREAYSQSAARQDAMTFMATLKQQVDAFMKEAQEEMHAAGFATTPWD